MTLAELIQADVAERGRSTGCWIWQRCLSTDGYGHLLTPLRRHAMGAHRYAYMVAHKVDLTTEQYVCHSCDNPPCYNPDHLWLGTLQDNIRDRDHKGRQWDRNGSKSPWAVIDEETARFIFMDPRSSLQLEPHVAISGTAIRRIRNRQAWSVATRDLVPPVRRHGGRRHTQRAASS